VLKNSPPPSVHDFLRVPRDDMRYGNEKLFGIISDLRYYSSINRIFTGPINLESFKGEIALSIYP